MGTRLEVEAQMGSRVCHAAAVRQTFPDLPTPSARALRLSLKVPSRLRFCPHFVLFYRCPTIGEDTLSKIYETTFYKGLL